MMTILAIIIGLGTGFVLWLVQREYKSADVAFLRAMEWEKEVSDVVMSEREKPIDQWPQHLTGYQVTAVQNTMNAGKVRDLLGCMRLMVVTMGLAGVFILAFVL